MQTKVKDTVNEYSIELFEDGKVEKNKEIHEIIAIKEHEKRGKVFAISDDYQGIEVLQSVYEKNGLNTTIDKAIIWERKWNFKGSVNSIYVCIYITQKDDKKVYSKLKKEIEKYLTKKYGRYGNYIDLLNKIEI